MDRNLAAVRRCARLADLPQTEFDEVVGDVVWIAQLLIDDLAALRDDPVAHQLVLVPRPAGGHYAA